MQSSITTLFRLPNGLSSLKKNKQRSVKRSETNLKKKFLKNAKTLQSVLTFERFRRVWPNNTSNFFGI